MTPSKQNKHDAPPPKTFDLTGNSLFLFGLNNPVSKLLYYKTCDSLWC